MKKLLFIIMALLLFTTAQSGPFAAKYTSYKHNSYQKSKPNKKDAFVCVKHKKVNRKGLMR